MSYLGYGVGTGDGALITGTLVGTDVGGIPSGGDPVLQSAKKVFPTILAACPLVKVLFGLK